MKSEDGQEALKADVNTRLALDRTFLAHERTLMGWIRTSGSLISFGFTIYNFFLYMASIEGKATQRAFGPREFALAMIGLGIAVLGLAAIQHGRDIRQMELDYGKPYRSLAGKLAAMVSLLGVGLLVIVLFGY